MAYFRHPHFYGRPNYGYRAPLYGYGPLIPGVYQHPAYRFPGMPLPMSMPVAVPVRPCTPPVTGNVCQTLHPLGDQGSCCPGLQCVTDAHQGAVGLSSGQTGYYGSCRVV
jgi:hypothetical protein